MENKRLILYAIVVIAALCIFFLPGFSKLQRLREENDVLNKRITLLEQHNEDLKEDMQKLKQDPDHVERRAREKLGIVKKGEVIYQTNKEGL